MQFFCYKSAKDVVYVENISKTDEKLKENENKKVHMKTGMELR